MSAKANRVPILLLLPFFLLLAVFWLVPLINGIDLSLRANNLTGPGEYVGLHYYRGVFGDERYFKAIKNTLLYAALSLGVILPLALLLAQALRMTWSRLRPVLTFLLLLPGLTPPAVLALLFLLVFHGREGLLNQLFVLPLGFKTVNWLKDPSFIMPALVMQAVWRWVGFITFFMLAGIEAIPKTLFEAAHLETNSRWRVFFSVTLPQLRPVVLFAAVYLLVDAFALFSGAYVLLGGSGGTADAGLLLVSYTYQQAFGFGNFASAAAMSVSVAPLMLGLLAMCFVMRWRRGARA